MLKDFRYALRTLRQNPGFALTAILSIALASGANSAIFSFADALALRPLDVEKPTSVVSLRSVTPTQSASPMADTTADLSYPDFIDFRDKSRSFAGVVAYDLRGVGFSRDRDSQTQMRMGYTVSGNFFDVLGLRAAIGRTFRIEEDQVPGRNPVVVLAHNFWKQEFGSDPSIVGRGVRLNGVDFSVIGVAPESFKGMDQFIEPAFFIPFMMTAAIDPNENVTTKRENRTISVKARLRPGVSLEAADAEIGAIARSLAGAYPATNRAAGAAVRSELRMRLEKNPVYGPLIASLFVLVMLVLLIACCNVANLMLGRGRARTREMATRLAIGASRYRIIRRLMAENFVIGLSGSALGLFIAQAAVDFFSRIEVVGDIPIRLNFELNGRVFAFTLIVSVLSSIVFGLAPALQSTRLDLAAALKTGEADRPTRQLLGRSALVTVQIAVSLVLLIGASQIYRGARAMLDANHAFRAQRTLTMRFDTEIAGYNQPRTEQFYKTLVEQARETPGVKSVALSSFLPLTSNTRSYPAIPQGYDFPEGQEAISVFESTVDDRYFETLNVPIIKGRGFLPTDTSTSPPVAVLNEAFANKYLGAEPLGKRIQINLPSGSRAVEVVGIAATGQYVSLVESPTGFMYLPLSQKPETRMALIVETDGDPAALAGPIRELTRSIDPNVPILAVRTMDDIFDKAAVMSTQLITVMFASASMMGLFLAIVGLYALVTYQVSRRTREIGIRVALGAERLEVMKMVLKQASKLGVSGIAIGLVLSISLGGALTMGRSELDPVNLTVLPLALLLITLIAAWIPARRASQISPLQALREE